ncbi:MAG: phosphatase PAP2 family protein [Candidatus Micrarchaeota archaeon]
MFELIQSFDNAVLTSVQGSLGFLEPAFHWITYLGHPGFWFAIACILYWNSREKESFWMVNLIVFTSVVIGALKAAFMRPRPTALQFFVAPENSLVSGLGESPYSFPSGHAGIIGSMTLFFLKPVSQIKKLKKNHWLVLGILLIILVDLSRLVLGAHFFSDVVAGTVVGLLVGWAAWQTHLRLEKKGIKLSKLDDELGFLLTLVLAIVLLVWINPPLLTAVVLGFYGGFFWVQKAGFVQSAQNRKNQAKKTVVGLIITAILVFAALKLPSSMEQFLVFFCAGLWVSAAWPWLFERVFTPKKHLKTVPRHNS